MSRLLPGISVGCFALLALITAPPPSQAAETTGINQTLGLPQIRLSPASKRPADWKGQGMLLVVLAGDTADLAPFKTFGAQARLGWNEQGIVAWIEVSDSAPFESEDNERLYEGDSVALIVNGADPKDGQVEFVATAGGTAKQKIQRSVAVDHRTRAMRALHGAAIGTAALRRTKSGYVAQLLVPWSNFGGAAKLGDSFGARVTINGRETATGPRSKLTFVLPGQEI